MLNINNSIWTSWVLRCLKNTNFVWTLLFAFTHSIFRRFITWLTWIRPMIWNNWWLSSSICYFFVLILILKFGKSWWWLIAVIDSRWHKFNGAICPIVRPLIVKLLSCKVIECISLSILIFSEVIVECIVFTWHHLPMTSITIHIYLVSKVNFNVWLT